MASNSGFAGTNRREHVRTMYTDDVSATANTSTSDEEDDDVFDMVDRGGEDTASIIGVSISKDQSRLKSPTTPAIEKLAAISAQGGFFRDEFAPNESQESDSFRPDNAAMLEGARAQSQTQKESVDKKIAIQTPPTLPSPWRAGPRTFQRSEESGQLLGSVFRKRSSSGPERKLRLPLQLPSLPNLPNLPMPRLFGSNSDRNESIASPDEPSSAIPQDISRLDGSIWNRDSWNDFVARRRGQTINSGKPSQSSLSLTPKATPSQSGSRTPVNTSADLPTDPRPSLGLRRATSDQSLYLARTLSKASSLGDDTRFENVHEQINSRFKAIKDSWQDSNLRRNLPSLPKAISTSRVDLNEYSNGVRKSVVATERKSSALPPRGSLVASSGNAPMHPSFTEALDCLSGDIVVLGGYRGSILREAQAPHRRVWLPILKAGLGLKRPNLEVGFEDEDEDRITDTVIPGGMLTHIGPVDISKRLLKRLRNCENAKSGRLRVHEYGYDWRLSPHRLSKQLVKFLESLPSNSPVAPTGERGATVIAHSLGGLITRHAVNTDPHLFSGVLYAGVPDTCVNILGPIRFGDPVLFNSDVLTAQVNLSIRTSIVLLPLNGRCFIDKETNEEYPVDFYDVNDWIKYRLSPCTDPPLPARIDTNKTTGIMGTVSSIIPDSLVSAMPNFIARRDSTVPRNSTKPIAVDALSSSAQAQHADAHAEGVPNAGVAPQMKQQDTNSPPNGVTISRTTAIDYLRRILPRIRVFREELAHNPSFQDENLYPPLAVMYGKTEPTVAGARVHGRDGIARVDAYSALSFASGDGVVLSRAAQLPEGYRAARGGVIASERGHVTLLGDLEAVGKCLLALRKARLAGVGVGL